MLPPPSKRSAIRDSGLTVATLHHAQGRVLGRSRCSSTPGQRLIHTGPTKFVRRKVCGASSRRGAMPAGRSRTISVSALADRARMRFSADNSKILFPIFSRHPPADDRHLGDGQYRLGHYPHVRWHVRAPDVQEKSDADIFAVVPNLVVIRVVPQQPFAIAHSMLLIIEHLAHGRRAVGRSWYS